MKIACRINMKTTLFFLAALLVLLTGCVNKHGISAKYYSDCKEYYDLQGFYHKECGDDDIVTYKQVQKKSIQIEERVKRFITKEPLPSQKNVW